jgi:hypothetical protein
MRGVAADYVIEYGSPLGQVITFARSAMRAFHCQFRFWHLGKKVVPTFPALFGGDSEQLIRIGVGRDGHEFQQV